MYPNPRDPRVRRGEICVECGAPCGHAVGHTRLCPRCRNDIGDGDGGWAPPRRPKPRSPTTHRRDGEVKERQR
jgi:hypothetical protein